MQGEKEADDARDEDNGAKRVESLDAGDGGAGQALLAGWCVEEEGDEKDGQGPNRKVDIEAPSPGHVILFQH